ncbi:MAG: HAD family hydrolase [Rikenellaceae bacterium]
MNRAIFLDRDGTINVDHGYMHDTDLLEFLPGVVEALQKIAAEGYKLILITNQSGIGRGYFTEQQYQTFNDALTTELKNEGVEITQTFMCPHAPADDCKCRKPYPQMILQAIEKYNIDPKVSFMFGDKPSDVECGEAAGVTSRQITADQDLLYWINEIIEKRL